jgi:hypothetical protein
MSSHEPQYAIYEGLAKAGLLLFMVLGLIPGRYTARRWQRGAACAYGVLLLLFWATEGNDAQSGVAGLIALASAVPMLILALVVWLCLLPWLIFAQVVRLPWDQAVLLCLWLCVGAGIGYQIFVRPLLMWCAVSRARRTASLGRSRGAAARP